MRHLILVLLALTLIPLSCSTRKDATEPGPPVEPPVLQSAPEAEATTPPMTLEESAAPCTNGCTDYSTSWQEHCPEGNRCLTFINYCEYEVGMAYQVGCNADGSKGAPQCDCTSLPNLEPNGITYWVITDGNWTDCHPWQPACLTAGFEVMAHKDGPDCTEGTRIEFSAGNTADIYGKFDSYNLDTELGFSVPVKFSPDLICAVDSVNHDCRPLWCGNAHCPDAYADPTQGGCPDGRSPQGGCQDTFGAHGYTVEFCPPECTAESCPSCQDAKPCN